MLKVLERQLVRSLDTTTYSVVQSWCSRQLNRYSVEPGKPRLADRSMVVG